MASDSADTQEVYPEVYVGPNCYVQTAEDRFGPKVRPGIRSWLMQGFDTDDWADLDFQEFNSETDEDTDEGLFDDDYSYEEESFDSSAGDASDNSSNSPNGNFPRIASARNNLTALSQHFNLYFVAYGSCIYVYQPRRGPQILPSSPSAILSPSASQFASLCRQSVFSNRPHQINHLIVGDLGNLEIVLAAYDDGDVVAYYSETIVSYIEANEAKNRSPTKARRRSIPVPKPFFHDNVQSTAWGIAIHKQSRLIAVSSNQYEVTVFAFALRRNGAVNDSISQRPSASTDQKNQELQSDLRSRNRTWRIVMNLSSKGHNIPNISFLDDEHGEAEKVVAIDIWANVWLLDIWTIGAQPIMLRNQMDAPYLHAENTWRRAEGWGIMVLPDSAFRPTDNIRECLGLPAKEVALRPPPDDIPDAKGGLDITYTDDSFGYEHVDEDEDTMVQTDDELASECGAVSEFPVSSSLSPDESLPEESLEKLDDSRLARVIVPLSGEITTLETEEDWTSFSTNGLVKRRRAVRPIAFADAELSPHLTKNFHLLIGNPTDIRLRPLKKTMSTVDFRHLLPHQPPLKLSNTNYLPSFPYDFSSHYTERVSMLLRVPELNLVIAGSPTGRVALLTPTSSQKHIHEVPVRRAFRVDRVLPRREEEERMLRPLCSLIGVACSPVPHMRAPGMRLAPSAGARAGQSWPALWRLILHYKDHTLLMYELARSRPGGEDELMIF
ncbi:uncharacterized protein CTHT_0056200 [Thermochaetoides thermophila DSM 1495]|uniref:Uncharacterized protein n=1 Tax=Chaetomium thermophilum (strain DSM 1495 / CBS 144.50 / IMI 039719) TaxID=759272 RepID=G0SC74_CHATD|nr:hypothetical protein CTHT_0056200 [Thermochaetoides thermophila DSM 1495]EGS19000.1 hypothetical protein CTHT_0056200 [Thermochaetoides thermophila DSM 1495]